MTVPDDVVESLLETILLELDIEPGDATDAQEAKLRRRIKSSAGKVLLFLNRDSFVTVQETVPNVWRDERYAFNDPRAWPWLCQHFTDRVRYKSHVVNADDADTYDVTFDVGLSLTDPEASAIVDYIVADVLETIPFDRAFPDHEQRVTSVSGGGQSISFEKRPTTSDAAGGNLTLASLGRFKRYTVGVSHTTARAPWPYGSSR